MDNETNESQPQWFKYYVERCISLLDDDWIEDQARAALKRNDYKAKQELDL